MRGFVVGFKTLDAGCGKQKPSPWERELSSALQFPEVLVIYFFSAVCTRTVLLPERSSSLRAASGEYPGLSNSRLAPLLQLLLFVLLRVPSHFCCGFSFPVLL